MRLTCARSKKPKKLQTQKSKNAAETTAQKTSEFFDSRRPLSDIGSYSVAEDSDQERQAEVSHVESTGCPLLTKIVFLLHGQGNAKCRREGNQSCELRSKIRSQIRTNLSSATCDAAPTSGMLSHCYSQSLTWMALLAVRCVVDMASVASLHCCAWDGRALAVLSAGVGSARAGGGGRSSRRLTVRQTMRRQPGRVGLSSTPSSLPAASPKPPATCPTCPKTS